MDCGTRQVYFIRDLLTGQDTIFQKRSINPLQFWPTCSQGPRKHFVLGRLVNLLLPAASFEIGGRTPSEERT